MVTSTYNLISSTLTNFTLSSARVVGKDYLGSLPGDVLLEIMNFLGGCDLVRMECVCKRFSILLNSNHKKVQDLWTLVTKRANASFLERESAVLPNAKTNYVQAVKVLDLILKSEAFFRLAMMVVDLTEKKCVEYQESSACGRAILVNGLPFFFEKEGFANFHWSVAKVIVEDNGENSFKITTYTKTGRLIENPMLDNCKSGQSIKMTRICHNLDLQHQRLQKFEYDCLLVDCTQNQVVSMSEKRTSISIKEKTLLFKTHEGNLIMPPDNEAQIGHEGDLLCSRDRDWNNLSTFKKIIVQEIAEASYKITLQYRHPFPYAHFSRVWLVSDFDRNETTCLAEASEEEWDWCLYKGISWMSSKLRANFSI